MEARSRYSNLSIFCENSLASSSALARARLQTSALRVAGASAPSSAPPLSQAADWATFAREQAPTSQARVALIDECRFRLQIFASAQFVRLFSLSFSLSLSLFVRQLACERSHKDCREQRVLYSAVRHLCGSLAYKVDYAAGVDVAQQLMRPRLSASQPASQPARSLARSLARSPGRLVGQK